VGLPGCVETSTINVVTAIDARVYGTQAVFESLVNASYEPLRTFYGARTGITRSRNSAPTFTKEPNGSHKYINDYTTS